jgi:hypothetical protein
MLFTLHDTIIMENVYQSESSPKSATGSFRGFFPFDFGLGFVSFRWKRFLPFSSNFFRTSEAATVGKDTDSSNFAFDWSELFSFAGDGMPNFFRSSSTHFQANSR